MTRFRSFRPIRGLLALSIAVGLCALGTASASAAAPLKPTGRAAPAVHGGPGTVSLPSGAQACGSSAGKPSSSNATCSAAIGSAASSERVSTSARATKPRTAIASPRVAFSVSLSASAVALMPGGTTTLTATSNQDVGPTQYYIELFDATTGGLLAACGSGTTCSANVTQAGSAVRNYLAYVSDYGSGYPPPGIQASSSWVNVSWLTVSLSASAVALAPGDTTTLTASASLDVGPTPYFIEIFDATAGALVVECGTGSSCSANVNQASATVRNYVAYVSAYGTTYPPANIRASSNWVNVSWLTASIGSSRSGLYLNVTGYVNLDIDPTPYYIEVFQWNGGSPVEVAVCGSGTSCGTGYLYRPSADYYIAYVSGYGTTWTPPNIRASSGWIYV